MYIVEARNEGWAKLAKIPTKLNPADIFTKPKGPQGFKEALGNLKME